MRLHGRDGLDATGTGADDGDTVVLPLLLLIVLGPPRGVDDLTLELLHPFNVRPLEVVQNAGAVEEDVTSLLEDADGGAVGGIGLLEFDEPFASLLLPVTSNDFRVEGHVFPETPHIAHLVQIFPDVGAVGEEAWPIRLSGREANAVSATGIEESQDHGKLDACTYVQGKGISVRMTGNITCTACTGVGQENATSRHRAGTYQGIYSPTMFHQYLGS